MQVVARVWNRGCARLGLGATQAQGVASLVVTFCYEAIKATDKGVCAYRGAWVFQDGYNGSVRVLPSVAEEHTQRAAAHGGERYHKNLRMQGWC